jgi:hypothetical protein
MREKLKELTSRSPRALGLNRSRWTLEMLREHLGEKAPETDSGTWHMLDRLGLTHTRGQGYALSPDEQFEAKRAFIDGVCMRSSADESEADPEKSPKQGTEDRLFYLDELTYELHPTIENEWSLAGEQPTARRGTCGQREGRLLAAMDAESGQLFYRQKQSVNRTDLTDLYREMASCCETNGNAQRLWVVQDNAPFHFHADVLGELEAQVWPRAHPEFEYPLPSQWPDPTDAALSGGGLPVQLVPLPTYASWLNPIERLWRWLKQEVLHLHPYVADWKRLKRGVRSFLERFTEGSIALLRYTGVSGD